LRGHAALEVTANLCAAPFPAQLRQLTEFASITAAAQNYARCLAGEFQVAGPITNPQLRQADQPLHQCATAIEERIQTGQHGTHVRSASLIELALRTVPAGDNPARPALRDLTLLDGALARLAAALHMQVRVLEVSDQMR
jgi:hypothetical protein